MRLHFNWKLSLFVVICLPVVIRAGYWQLDRADEKEQMQAQLNALQNESVIEFQNLYENQKQNYRNVSVKGEYQQSIFLIDNQIHHGVFGYEVIQPLLMTDGEMLLISRGWIKGDLDRRNLPTILTPERAIELKGYLYAPTENIQLDEVKSEEGWPKRMQSASVEKLYSALGKNDSMHSKFVLRLNSSSKSALESHWQLIRTGPEKHLGYATQWFAMAVLLVGLFIWASISKENSARNTH